MTRLERAQSFLDASTDRTKALFRRLGDAGTDVERAEAVAELGEAKDEMEMFTELVARYRNVEYVNTPESERMKASREILYACLRTAEAERISGRGRDIDARISLNARLHKLREELAEWNRRIAYQEAIEEEKIPAKEGV